MARADNSIVRFEAGPNAALEGDDPPDDSVTDEEAAHAMTDCMGGNVHRHRAQMILARFKRERWRIIREG